MELQIIHVVLGKANPDRMNGVNKVVNSLASQQAALGKNVTLWGITKNPVHDYPERNYNTRLFKDVGRYNISIELKMAIEFLEDENVIFHLHGGFIPQFSSVAKLLVKHGLEYVFTPHGAFNTVALKRSSIKKKAYIKLFENFLVQQAKHIHLIGESEVTGTQKVFGKVNCELIPNGQKIPSNAVSPNSKNGNSAPLFGFVGRLDLHTKGLDTLLKAFAKYSATTNNNSQLALIGDGPDRTKLEKLAQKLDIVKQMKFYGAKYGTEKDQLVKQLDYLCLTSRNEGLPGVVLEAASCGIPAIVSKETNLGPAIYENYAGFVTEKNDVENLVNALVQADESIKSNQREQQARNAFRMVQNEFNWSDIAQQHLLSYEAS